MTDVKTIALADFLLARIAEDEADGPWHFDWCSSVGSDDHPCDCTGSTRVRAECQAKRRIVELATRMYEHTDMGSATDEDGWAILADLAAVYIDHPDYRREWAV